MKKNEVQIGKVYSARVTNKVVPVRIDAENSHGGWDATNLETKKKVRIKSAQRLRKCVDPAKAKRTKATSAPQAKPVTQATQEAKPAKERDTGEPVATSDEPVATPTKPMSLLDAAAHLLALGTRDPMRCRDMVDLAIARQLWKPGKGKTPANTLHAAIQREIQLKGPASRFVKADRGKFALNPNL